MRHFAKLAFCPSLSASACERDNPPPPAAPLKPSPELAARSAEPKLEQRAPSNAGPEVPSKPLNVLLVTIDSLRADMPWTGYERPIAPYLTQFAKESIVYTNAYSVSSYTAKSIAALLSGRYPSTLYRSGWFFANYAPANRFFPEALQEKGIRTLGWHGHMYFGRGKGLEQGFDVWELAPGISFDPNTDKHITSEKLTKLGIDLLSKPENTGKQFFAWVHYMDPHDEYNKHPESPDFGKKNRDRYDSEVFFTDLWVGKFLDFAKQQPWWKDTAVIISADHGEAFGEHGMYKHAFELWESLTRIPLIVHLPNAAPRTIDERRSAIDLPPTIMDLMGQKPLDTFLGQSLKPELRGAPAKPREFIVTELTEDSHNPERSAILVGDYKLLVYGKGASYQLYDIKNDAAESKDLAKSMPDKLAELKKLYETHYSAVPKVEPYGGMKLKSGREARGMSRPADDPKN